MPGPRAKSPERRQRRNAPASPQLGVVLPPSNATPMPAPPVDKVWLAGTKKEWADLWAHPITTTFDRVLHEPVLRRLFTLRDDRERFNRMFRKSPMVEGSQGQQVINPLAAQLRAIDSELRQLEDRFGLNISSLLKLGIQFGEAKRSLDQMAKELYADDDEVEEEDPRLADAIDVEVAEA